MPAAVGSRESAWAARLWYYTRMLADLLTWLDAHPYLWPLFIVPARVLDVSIGTVRTIAVVRGRRGLATVLGFFEVLVWVSVVSGVLVEVTAIKLVSYAAGFALGNLVGIKIEERIALGHQLVTVISDARQQSVAFALRLSNLVVTEVPAKGREGEVALCFTVVPRRRTAEVIAKAKAVDNTAHVVVEDLRSTDLGQTPAHVNPSGWRGVFKRK